MKNKVKNPSDSLLSRKDYKVRYQHLSKNLPDERVDITFATQDRSNIPGSVPNIASVTQTELMLMEDGQYLLFENSDFIEL